MTEGGGERMIRPDDPRAIDLGVERAGPPAVPLLAVPPSADPPVTVGSPAGPPVAVAPPSDRAADRALVGPPSAEPPVPVAPLAGHPSTDADADANADAESGAAAIEPGYAWAPSAPVAPRPLAGIALWLAIAGLGMSLVVGWAFAVGVGAIIVGVVALRRPGDRRGVAIWALGLAALSLVYSAAWLAWAVTRL